MTTRILGRFVIYRLDLLFSTHIPNLKSLQLLATKTTVNAKCRNCGGLGWLGVTQGHKQCRRSIAHMTS